MRILLVPLLAVLFVDAGARAQVIVLPQGAPVAGESDLSRDEVRRLVEDAGYTAVAGLIVDEDGIWRGFARRDGMTVAIAVDDSGSIRTNRGDRFVR